VWTGSNIEIANPYMGRIWSRFLTLVDRYCVCRATFNSLTGTPLAAPPLS